MRQHIKPHSLLRETEDLESKRSSCNSALLRQEGPKTSYNKVHHIIGIQEIAGMAYWVRLLLLLERAICPSKFGSVMWKYPHSSLSWHMEFWVIY